MINENGNQIPRSRASLRESAPVRPQAAANDWNTANCAARELRCEHPHLIELTQRKLLCACDACAMLFSGRAGTKYKRVPRDVRLLADFHMTDAEWDGLLIPINLAFFFQNSQIARQRLLSQPGGSDRVAAAARSLERHRAGQSGLE